MNCVNCLTETNNPKFCSSSCSASFSNKLKPRRKPEGSCKVCKQPLRTSRTYCELCWSTAKITRKAKANEEEFLKAKKCCKCSLSKPIDEFYRQSGKKNRNSWCKLCLNSSTTFRQQKLKQNVVNYLGGKCKLCTYDKYIGALELHHKNPLEKDFSIAQKNLSSFDSIKNEVDKCVLVCANCHREEHERIRNGIPTKW